MSRAAHHPYRLIAKLGAGGMGEVYLVEHLSLGRREAIKILHEDLAREPELVRRFRREARAAHRVLHPNIVGVYDFGQLPDGRFFLAMEYVEGARLDDAIAAVGRFDVARGLEVLVQLTRAIAHAHARDVVHRDLKPANVLLADGDETRVKVLDFGIAKITAPDYRESGIVTKDGEVYGSPFYVAPEVWRGAPAHPAQDIYSIGCIAFEVMTGARLFRGKSMDVMHQHFTVEPPRLSHAREEPLPEGLDEAVRRCLRKSPDARYADGEELLADLEQVVRAAARRSQRRIRLAPADFGDETTAGSDTEVGHSGAATLVDPGLLVREVAESLQDMGVHDVSLSVALARVKEVEDDIARAEALNAALESEAAGLSRASQEREAALRFALAELCFERDGQAPSQELDQEISRLEHRLSTHAARAHEDLVRITNRQVELTAQRAEAEERLARLWSALRDIVDQLSTAHADDPAFVALSERLPPRDL